MNKINRRDMVKVIGATWLTPVVTSVTLPAHAQTSVPPVCCNTTSEEPPAEEPSCTVEWNKSSFVFTSDFVVCNHGDGESLCPVRYSIDVASNETGKPVYDVNWARGLLEPLGFGCYDFTADMTGVTGRYCITVYQDNGHPGTGILKSCGEVPSE